MTIKFKCPTCGCKRLREFSKMSRCLLNATTWYACDQCKAPIKNETGDLLHCAADLLDWLNERNMAK